MPSARHAARPPLHEVRQTRAMDSTDLSHGIAALSLWIDEGNRGRDPEVATWARLAKITEADVQEELLDVALTALAALEHLRDHDERSIELLTDKLGRTLQRAGLHG